jgi:NAD(P)-dependent dehydrogenase (short-subunit alcohol dehydrogenase family)
MSFEGMTVIVTGAGQGMGRAHALSFASAGANVVVNDVPPRDGGPSVAEAVVEEIQAAGGRAVAVEAAVGSEDAGEAIIDAALSEFGGVEVVVNNAGILRDRAFHKMSESDWNDVLMVHLSGAYFVTRAAWPHFRERGFGRVVVTTSISGLYGQFGQANYSAAKLGLVGMIRTLALEGEKYGITANAVSPVASTDMNAHILSDEEKGRLRPDYVCAAVRFLASRECSLNGHVVHAAGGHYSRVDVAHTQGFTFDHVPTVEEIAQKWDEIGAGPWLFGSIDI